MAEENDLEPRNYCFVKESRKQTNNIWPSLNASYFAKASFQVSGFFTLFIAPV